MVSQQYVAGGGQGILLHAQVDDRTQTFFSTIDNRMNQLNIQTLNINRDMAASSRKSAVGFGLISGAVNALTHHMIMLGREAMNAMKTIAVESTKAAARADTLSAVLNVVGQNAGYTVDELAMYEEQVKKSGITTNATRQVMLGMIQANLDLSKAVEVTTLAQNAAYIAEINSSESAERLIHGIASMNPLILKHLGIIVNFEQAYRRYGDSIGVAADFLSPATKQQVALNETLRAGIGIAGAYDAAMGTIGKRAQSLTRFTEELERAFGSVFQPAYGVWIDWLTERMIELTDYFDSGAEELVRFGESLESVMRDATQFVDTFVSAMQDVPTLFTEAVADLLVLVGLLTENEKIERLNNLSKTWQMAMSNMSYNIAFLANLLTRSAEFLLNAAKAAVNIAVALGGLAAANIPFWDQSRNTQVTLEAMIRLGELATDQAEIFANTYDESIQKANEAFMKTAESYGLIGSVSGLAVTKNNDLTSSFIRMQREIDEVTALIQDLNSKISKDMAEALKKATREGILDDLRDSWKREDIERNYQDRLIDLQRDYARRRQDLLDDIAEDEEDAQEDRNDKRLDIEKDYAREKIDIEREYQRELQDIQRHFEQDVEEAARSNDAVSVAKLFRQRAKDVEDAKIGRNRDLEDAKIDYDRELEDLKEANAKKDKERQKDRAKKLKDLEEDYKWQLERAKEAYDKEYEDLKRSNERDKILKDLYRKWDREDLIEKYRADIIALSEYVADAEFIDEAGLRYLLQQHGEYITTDLGLWAEYYNQRRILANQALLPSGTAPLPPQPGPYPEGYDPDDPMSDWQFASGGMGLFTTPSRVMFAENEPEMVAAIPMSKIYQHDINMKGSMDVNGVSPDMEAQVSSMIYNILAQFGEALLSQQGVRRR